MNKYRQPFKDKLPIINLSQRYKSSSLMIKDMNNNEYYKNQQNYLSLNKQTNDQIIVSKCQAKKEQRQLTQKINPYKINIYQEQLKQFNRQIDLSNQTQQIAQKQYLRKAKINTNTIKLKKLVNPYQSQIIDDDKQDFKIYKKQQSKTIESEYIDEPCPEDIFIYKERKN